MGAAKENKGEDAIPQVCEILLNSIKALLNLSPYDQNKCY